MLEQSSKTTVTPSDNLHKTATWPKPSVNRILLTSPRPKPFCSGESWRFRWDAMHARPLESPRVSPPHVPACHVSISDVLALTTDFAAVFRHARIFRHFLALGVEGEEYT